MTAATSERKKVQLSVSVPAEWVERLDAISAKRGDENRTSLLREAIYRYLEQES